jgi:HlyD family secretion protein
MPLLHKYLSPLLARTRLFLVALLALALLIPFVWPMLSGLFVSKVVVLTAVEGDITQSIVASGKVRTPQRVELASQITGRVSQILASEGQLVHTGQVLIEMDDAEWRAAVAQAKAALAQSETKQAQTRQLALPLALQAQRQAEANQLQARQQFARTRELVAQGFYSRTQLDDAQRNLNVAESQWQAAQLQAQSSEAGGSDYRLAQIAVDQARASLEVTQARLGYARIGAPLAGTVLTRSVERGDTAQPGKVLMTLSPTGTTELVVQIDEKNLRLLKLGQKALASADAYPEQRFTAEIIFISPAIDPLRGSVEIRLRVAETPEAPDYLRQEMTVSVDIKTEQRTDALVAPLDAIHGGDSAEPWALVVRDGRAQRQPLVLGLRGGGKVEILHGVAQGELLVPVSNASVRDGSRVRPVTG